MDGGKKGWRDGGIKEWIWMMDLTISNEFQFWACFPGNINIV